MRGLRPVRLVTVALLAVAAATFLSWALEFVLPTGLSVWRSPVDEASAGGQPFAEVFRTVEMVAGGLFVVLVPPLLRLAPIQPLSRLTVLAVGGFGVVLVAHAWLPLDCAASVSELCRTRAVVSPEHRAHLVLNEVLTVIYLCGAASLVFWWPPRWRLVSLLVFVVVALCELGLHLAVDVAGLAGRVQLTAMSVLFFLGSAYLLRAGRMP